MVNDNKDFINRINDYYKNGKDISKIAEQILYKLKDILISFKVKDFFNNKENDDNLQPAV